MLPALPPHDKESCIYWVFLLPGSQWAQQENVYIHLYLFRCLSLLIENNVFILIPPIPIQRHKVYSRFLSFPICVPPFSDSEKPGSHFLNLFTHLIDAFVCDHFPLPLSPPVVAHLTLLEL